MRTYAPWFLLAGDLLCLSAFVVLGLGTHAELGQASALQRFLINAGPLALTWTTAGLALGAFRLSPPLTMRALLARTLTTWLVAAPLALILRALLLGSATLILIFVLVTLGVGGALLLAWRALFYGLVLRR
jgi:hypothetical protein